MKITTLDIIRILPIAQQTKDSLLQQWGTLDPDMKFELEQLLWDAYDTIYDIKLEENINLELLKASKEEIKLDEDFYSRMKEKTEGEMQQTQRIEVDSSELADIRGKLESFMKTDTVVN